MTPETKEEKLQQHRADWHYDAECAKLGINPEWYFDERNTLGMSAACGAVLLKPSATNIFHTSLILPLAARPW